MRGLLWAVLTLALSIGVRAQTFPGGPPPSAPPSVSPLPGQMPPPITGPSAPSLGFTTFPTAPVQLHGREPGASVQIAARGGKGPLSLTFNVDPVAYTTYFSLIATLDTSQLPPPLPPQQQSMGSSPKMQMPAVPSTRQWLHFRGLPGNQGLPSGLIHVFMRVSDSAGAVIVKAIDVKLTNSAAAPVITGAGPPAIPGDRVPTPQPSGNPWSLFEIHHRGFLLSEPGSYFECMYSTGIRYRCYPWNGNHNASVTALLVPDLNLGAAVTLRLVNDSGVSAPVMLRMDNRSVVVTETAKVIPRGPVGVAFSQLDKTAPQAAAPYIGNKATSCGKFYLTWNDVSQASGLRPDQVLPVPASVKLKSRPASGSVMTNSNVPQWEWSVAVATALSFQVTYEYTYRVGACDGDLVR